MLRIDHSYVISYVWKEDQDGHKDYTRYLQVHAIDETNALRGMIDKKRASIFYLEQEVAPRGLEIMFNGEGAYENNMYIAQNTQKKFGRQSIQATHLEKPLTLTLEPRGKTIKDWTTEGCSLKTPDGGYVGYNKEHGLVEYYASGAEEKPGGGVCLWCKLEEIPQEKLRHTDYDDEREAMPPIIN